MDASGLGLTEPPRWIDMLFDLRTLNLSNNNLSDLDVNFLRQTETLASVDVTGNPMRPDVLGRFQGVSGLDFQVLFDE